MPFITAQKDRKFTKILINFCSKKIKYINTIDKLKLCEYKQGCRFWKFYDSMTHLYSNSNLLSARDMWITSLPMAGNPLRPLQGGSSRTTLLREPRKLVSRTRTEERQVEGGGSSREPRAEAARREVVSAAPPAHGGVTINGTSGGPRSSMPLPRQRSHRNPPCSDASKCSHSNTARS